MAGFVDSQFKFTDPVRFYKENDPYYWEVDNLPLKQIHENTKWLKDQILGKDQIAGISRADFNELKPSVEGGNNKILVQPGRFTARINDAYSKSPMQRLSMISGETFGDYERFDNPNGNAIAQSILDTLKQTVADQYDGLNGLMERVLSWPMSDENTPIAVTTDSYAGTTSSEQKWPLKMQGLYAKIGPSNTVLSTELQKMSVEFTKQFRGVGRTAVVDIPEQLSIEIPNFSDDDFFYFNNGVKTAISGAQIRVDLLFIYSKPIDASATVVQKWSGGQPTRITTPMLGLVKGAGVGISQGSNTTNTEWVAGTDVSNEGHTQIVPNIGDQSITTNGFQACSVHGSFPSPDDLMNLAPLISEKLADSDPQLIGQSILPIAYIIVRKGADTNAIGNVVLTDGDVFDIRPFFRTTELTYNERAGIMAATPPLSLANPAVTQFGLDAESKKLKDYATDLFSGGILSTPRVVAGGVIWGGKTFGAEGAINNLLVADSLAPKYGTEVPDYPDWDLAEWWDFDLASASNSGANKGQMRNDRINYYAKASNANLENGTGVPAGFLGILEGETMSLNTGNLIFSWIKKRIPIDKSNVGWLTDYVVRIQIENCLGVTSKSDNYSIAKGGAYGTWVERNANEFIIYVGWASNKVDSNAGYPQLNRDHGMHTQWIAKSSSFLNPSNSHQSKLAACTYPTVSFEVIGYPADWLAKALPQYPNTPLLTLR